MEPDKNNQKKAEQIQEPQKNFASPGEVVSDEKLSLNEKQTALKNWEQEARQLAVAEEEGMTGGEPSRLDEVKEAQSKLPEKPGRTPSPTKSG